MPTPPVVVPVPSDTSSEYHNNRPSAPCAAAEPAVDLGSPFCSSGWPCESSSEEVYGLLQKCALSVILYDDFAIW